MLPHISICIATYKRKELLIELLYSLINQHCENFTFNIIIVDNDAERSAQNVVKTFIEKNKSTAINYYCQPEKNIALARNTCLNQAHGDYIAFIDDDEIAVENWINSLYTTMIKYKADAVFGPVVPKYYPETPNWIIKSCVFERPRFITGTQGTIKNMARTSNALVKSIWFSKRVQPFNPNFGLTGGEDTDFFSFVEENCGIFIWSDEAVVYETVVRSRLNVKWIFMRGFRLGQVTVDLKLLHEKFKLPLLAKTFSVFFFRCCLLIIPIPFTFKAYAKKIMRILYSIGKISALLSNWRYNEYKNVKI